MGTGRLVRRLAAAVLLTAAVSGCSPPETQILVDLRLEADGSVTEEWASMSQGWQRPNDYRVFIATEDPEGPLDHDDTDQVREACLDDDTCIRLEWGAQILESRDGFETIDVAWDVGDPRAGWLSMSYGTSGVRTVAEVYDILVMPDGTALVAGGDLGVVRRSVDGVWTPSAADLRTVPKSDLIVLGVAMAAFMLLVGLAAGELNGPHVPSCLWWAVTLSVPGLLYVIGHFLTGDVSLQLAALVALAIVLTPLALTLLAAALFRALHVSRETQIVLPLLRSVGAGWVGGGVVAVLGYVAFSRARIPWALFLFGCALAAMLGAALVARTLRSHGRAPGPHSVFRERAYRNPAGPTILAVLVMIPGVVGLSIWAGEGGGIIGGLIAVSLLGVLLFFPKRSEVASLPGRGA